MEFECCDEFSKTHNIDVEVSKVKRLMFIYTNEIFDKSITEISKFIKSHKNKDYDCITVIRRNFYMVKNKANDVSSNYKISLEKSISYASTIQV